MSAPNCAECWGVSADVLVDAGMFGEKSVCASCYAAHYAPRPIIGRFTRDEETSR